MVSNLDYSPLKSVVINDDLEFCLREMLRQGGSCRFLVGLIFDWNKYSTDYSTVLKQEQY